MDFQDEETQATGTGKNPFNANILKGGKVNPKSKLYQRSVAGREQLKEYLQRLWDEGGDEADVFMSGVKSLMNRGHGYVGAYLDSKNPGRTYDKNQAMAITDQVMKDEGIGQHPGNRLTRPEKDDKEGREERKTSNQLRGTFGPQRPEGFEPKKAKSVRQQRKEGKREGTGEPVKGTKDWKREGLGQRESGPVSEWQKTLEDRLKGEASTQDVLAAFQKQYQSPLSQSPKAQKKKKAERKEESGATAPESMAPEEVGAPEPEGRAVADRVLISDKFKELVEDSIKAKLPINKNSLEDMIQETIEILEDDYDVDPEEARAAIFNRFKGKLIGGQKIDFDPSSAPETKQQQTPMGGGRPETSAPAGKPEPEAPAPREEAAGQPEPEAKKEPGVGGQQQPEEPSPREGEPSRRADVTRTNQPSGQRAPAELPQGRSKRQPLPEEKLVSGRGRSVGSGRGGEGFGGGSSRAAVKKKPEIMKAGKAAPTLEDFKSYLYTDQGSLFGKRGFETNPDAKPFLAGPEESAPSSDLPGTPSSRPAPPTAKAGKPGQQGLFRAGSLTPRTGRGFGSNVPKPPAQPASRYDYQPNLFGGGGKIESGPAQTEEPEEAGVREPATASRPGGAGQQTFLSRARGKETQILPSSIQVPKPAQGVTNAKGYTEQLRKAGIPSNKINQAVKSEFPPPARGRSRRKTVNSSEYQEFAQSVRSLMR